MTADRSGNDWQDLAGDWQAQTVPVVDIDGIRAEVERRGRTLRRVLVGEWLLTVFAALACGGVALFGDHTFDRVMFGGLALLVVAYQVAMTRLRRHEWNPAGSDAAAMVDLELRRARTVLRYWWIGLWTCVAMVLVPLVLIAWGHSQASPEARLAALYGAVAGMILAGVPTAIYGIWSCRRARARIVRYERLQQELAGP
ncbi:hypothetical protein [Arenimonas composti]|uniref:Transmembrane protein n=1 Tax=Arenimonas composti TR7-09 = DSM 18010 TaxID=1121013 RepID=A0A091BE69_9GAMM|nr:hypothetical protein [Arenimonas composti]KFN49832.1 hypothetical protein P873_08910 [Arenimonas composti TR7-09 = DSM 18010]